MNILYLPHHYRTPHQKGGLRSWHVSQALSRNNNIITITYGIDTLTGEKHKSLNKNKMYSYEKECRMEVYRVNAFKNDRKRKISRLLYYITSSIMQLYVSLLKCNKVECVIATNLPIFTLLNSYILACIFRSKYVVEVRDLPIDMALEIGYMKKNLFIGILKKIEINIYKKADKIVTVSNGMKKILESQGIDNKKIKVVYIGYDNLNKILPEYRKYNIIENIKNDFKGKHVLLYSGTMGHVINIDVLLQVARKLVDNKRIIFAFVGDGQKLDIYKQEAKDSELNCIFYGRVEKRYIDDICKMSDLCLYPLKNGDVSGSMLGNKIFDYMGAGKPIIYIGPKGDARELIVSSECGLCFNDNEISQIVESILNLLDDSQLAQKLGSNGLTAVRTCYTKDILMKQFVKEIDETMTEM